MGTGLLVTELMGQGVHVILLLGIIQEEPVVFGLKMDRYSFPSQEVTIAGNLKQMFKDIVYVGKDINPNIATRCGSVMIAEMMVAGS